jgi:DNA-directed RNA polymerase subunit RPC12/RpoP
MKTGHWFCTTCDDIVNLPATLENPLCPACHHRTVLWINETKPLFPKLPITDDVAAKGFAEMRALVAEQS